MRKIIFHKETKTFHLYNDKISYILCVLDNGHLGQLYFGKRIHDKADFSYLVEKCGRPMTSYIYEWDRSFSLEHIRQEYPVYGTTDYRHPAIELLQENGSRISEFQYDGYEISSGKPKLSGLPATYTEAEEEAQTLRVFLKDSLTGAQLELLYTIFEQYSAIARSARLKNSGNQNLHILNMMSLSLDLPDKDYIWMQLSGAWSRERYVKNRVLEQGITAIDSMRGNSSHEHNPFMVLKRENTDENVGEAIGVSLIYSGNFRIQAEVDTHDVTRITAGINPTGFDWKLEPMESFQTPEAMLVYSDQGLNGMSQTFQKLYAKRLARGYWRDRTRPILNNNWEATYFDFTEDRLVEIAGKAKECGVELFVLDDGWFGKRERDNSGLGDWIVNEMEKTTPEKGFHWGLMPLPALKEGGDRYVASMTEQVWIPKQAKNADDAKEFLKFIYSDKGVEIMAKYGNVVPTKGFQDKVDTMEDGYTKEFFSVYKDAKTVIGAFSGYDTNTLANFDLKATVFGPIDEIATGKTTVDEWQKSLSKAWKDLAANPLK